MNGQDEFSPRMDRMSKQHWLGALRASLEYCGVHKSYFAKEKTHLPELCPCSCTFKRASLSKYLTHPLATNVLLVRS